MCPFSSKYAVPDSPDLSMHVRSLQRSMTTATADYSKSDGSQRLSFGSEQGDLVLEDTGTVGTSRMSRRHECTI